jgi:3-dehydroquinate dehydratase
MFNLQESLDAHKKALQESFPKAQKNTLTNRKSKVKSAIVTVTKESIKKSLVDSGIITAKGKFTHLNISVHSNILIIQG